MLKLYEDAKKTDTAFLKKLGVDAIRLHDLDARGIIDEEPA